ncbi:MBL fold metallo-hydrolase [Spiroplasma endosymbiont of Diplazon laetatorius]|uniref:MBL fold metallo-hydrolase n=1 Tax=Spiroplasma endosymbiont of Diplazon laetatorius TaxID=3066322 RepID=UPI0030CCA2C8
MIQVFTCNDFKRVNAFLMHNEDKKAILFDTGYLAYKDIIDFVEKNNIQITDIFITHGHFPHFYGINEICKNQNNPNVFIGKEDLLNLFDSSKNLSELFEGVGSYIAEPIKNLKVISEETTLDLNGYKVNIYRKNSHTEGSLIFEIPEKKFIFTGDFILKDESYLVDGIMQLDDENEKNAKEIFNWIISAFDKNYSVFTGHYDYGFEIRNILEDKEAKLLRKYIEKD